MVLALVVFDINRGAGQMRTLLGVLGLIGLGAAGCAGHPAPTEQLASSLAAVRGAEEVGARNVPEAALHVKLAEEQIEQAKRLMNDDENAKAEDLAVRAYQDAELAIAIAREANSKQKLESYAANNGTAGGEQPVNQ
jgi:pyridoxal biosynthesis lyase PdxS